MVDNKHSWKDIKDYSLGEIGVFLTSIAMKINRANKQRELDQAKSEGKYIPPNRTISKEEEANTLNRLANFGR